MKKILFAVMLFLLILPVAWMVLFDVHPMQITSGVVPGFSPGKPVTSVLTDTGEYCKGFSDWFDSSFSLRDLYLRTKNQIKYSVFNTASDVYVGEEGYLSYKSVLEEQVACERLDDDALDRICKSFSDAADMLAEKDMQFYYMLPPLKNTVFPERTESFPVKRPSPTRYEELCGLLTEKMPDSFIDITDALKKAETVASVYCKTDLHWNSHAAVSAFSVLAERIAGRDIYPAGSYDIEAVTDFKGAQYELFSLLSEQPDVFNKAISDVRGVVIDDKGAIPQADMHIVNPSEAPLGRLLIVGDSYSGYLLDPPTGLTDCFSEIYYVNTNSNNFNGVFSALKSGQVDYVLFEKIETRMPDYEKTIAALMS